MGRYLTSRMNIPPTRSPRAILSVFCHHDFFLLLLYLFVYLFPSMLTNFMLFVVRPLQCKQVSWLRTLSQFAARFSCTVVCQCAESCSCYFLVSHVKCRSWLLIGSQSSSSVRNPSLMFFLQGGRTIFPSWFIMSMMNSYIYLYLLTCSSTST